MIKPVTWDHGELVLLDQTLLPGEERLLRCSTPEQVADGIRGCCARGAPAIGVAAAYGLALGLRMGRDGHEVVELLAGTRPTAVNLRCPSSRPTAHPPMRRSRPHTGCCASS